MNYYLLITEIAVVTLSIGLICRNEMWYYYYYVFCFKLLYVHSDRNHVPIGQLLFSTIYCSFLVLLSLFFTKSFLFSVLFLIIQMNADNCNHNFNVISIFDIIWNLSPELRSANTKCCFLFAFFFGFLFVLN